MIVQKSSTSSMNLDTAFNFKRVALALGLAFFLSQNLFSQSNQQSANYEIVVLGMRIGTMKAQKINQLDSVIYKVDSLCRSRNPVD